MTSKFELAISTGYVPDWGIVEAFRELFQNALDNEIINPENKMEWKYENDTVSIKNKTSKLPVESLLLGSSTKTNDNSTIGKHGEGYKIAFMVLLRNNKKIKVYNYGAREVWDVRLVKSKKYNGQLVPTVFVEKNHVWEKTPNSDLEIEVSGITNGEYKDVVSKNLHLRADTISKVKMNGRGDIILNSEEAGNIYVKGLFVRKLEGLQYGYDFEPRVISLDRDRKLLDSLNITWESSILWQNASSNDKEMSKIAVKMFKESKADVKYIHAVSYNAKAFKDEVALDFFEEYGEDAVPVVNNAEYEDVKSTGIGRPVIIREEAASVIRESSIAYNKEYIKPKSVHDRLKEFANKIESKLTDEELTELLNLIDKVSN